jgi:Mn-containing catalase
MTDIPVAREMIGYLLVRGGVHVVAYAKASTGVDMTKMVPIPNLENKAFDYARKFEDQEIHRKLFFSPTDYQDIDKKMYIQKMESL